MQTQISELKLPIQAFFQLYQNLLKRENARQETRTTDGNQRLAVYNEPTHSSDKYPTHQLQQRLNTPDKIIVEVDQDFFGNFGQRIQKAFSLFQSKDKFFREYQKQIPSILQMVQQSIDKIKTVEDLRQLIFGKQNGQHSSQDDRKHDHDNVEGCFPGSLPKDEKANFNPNKYTKDKNLTDFEQYAQRQLNGHGTQSSDLKYEYLLQVMLYYCARHSLFKLADQLFQQITQKDKQKSVAATNNNGFHPSSLSPLLGNDPGSNESASCWPSCFSCSCW